MVQCLFVTVDVPEIELTTIQDQRYKLINMYYTHACLEQIPKGLIVGYTFVRLFCNGNAIVTLLYNHVEESVE